MTARFMAYDEGYTGGVSLTTGWVAGAEGGAKSIVTGQLAGDGHGAGLVDGVAARRLSPACTSRARTTTTATVDVRPDRVVRSPSAPAAGVTVATTSTTSGADLLVSGAGPDGATVRKLALGQAESDRHHGGADRRRDAADARRGRRSRSTGRAVSYGRCQNWRGHQIDRGRPDRHRRHHDGEAPPVGPSPLGRSAVACSQCFRSGFT